jgi:hypothetical protein
MIWSDVAKVALILVGYILLTRVFLPKLGIPT